MIESVATIGKYKIVEEIGHGGFATVYKAVDTTLDREVALKVLDPLLTRDPAFTARFQQEAKVTAKLFHPNIAALVEVNRSEGRFFIAMQYIPGRNLRDLAQEKTLLSLDQIASIVQQIGAALDYAHAHDAIHRDVKPSNIIVDPSGHATLTDFGIVKALEATTIQTASGAILGTPSYSSPEQAESRPLDGRSDLYSLGIVAYELCTGKVPFVADTTPSLYYKIVHQEPPSPSQVHARVAGPIEPVLLKAIAKQPDQRYQTGQEFGAALAAAVEQVKGELTQSLYEQARALFAQEKLDEAEANLSQVLAIQPSHKGAQALLEQIGQRRESQQRYQELAGVVKQARAQAADLKQAYPDMADPDGLYRLLEDPGSQASRPAAQPAPTPARWAVSRVQLIVALVLLIGAIVIVLTGAQAGGVWVVVNSPEQTGLLHRLIVGNLVLGIGLGAGISGLLLLGLSFRKS
jgi:predicted Ser/Thr protein kinase